MTADDFVAPAYGDHSLADVLPAVARAIGRPLESSPEGLVLPEAGSYVVFLVDGLGRELLADHPEDAPFLASLLAGSALATAGVPSTTATSLTSLGTGMPPGGHGIVGFTARIPGTDRLINHLQWSKDVSSAEWQPHPTIFGRLAAQGVTTTAVNKREFVGSGLTDASSRGAGFVGADRWGERIVAVQAASSQVPSLTYVYDGDLDWTGHRYGVDSAQWRTQLSMTDQAAERLRETLPADVRIVVIADHGMVDADEASRVDVDALPELRDGVALLGGEARFRHLYCPAGAVDSVVATWRSVLGDRALVLPRDEAFATGWFGEVAPQVRPRIGDVVIAARGTTAVLSSRDFPYEARLVGMHGSLTPAEMLVPVLVS
ncbi:alkaline phosphatase family protein [Nocardioides marmoribigeumensis]|uniref:Alkaline phosphatase family protein n=1 Tax=Nocardioides marmoribigeumensis TaxID=433649 RepID=A0ABU2BT44_9ACTN|nr:alkaline phosphatase family protein [Nocardioides marmoribigeumensis]MDR7361169.1 hypothetical protein [Nocardioides marmoribigeumensis]